MFEIYMLFVLFCGLAIGVRGAAGVGVSEKWFLRFFIGFGSGIFFGGIAGAIMLIIFSMLKHLHFW